MDDDDSEGHVDTVNVNAVGLTVLVHPVFRVGGVPNHPNDDSTENGVHINPEDDPEEALAVDEPASEGEERGHGEGEALLLLDGAVLVKAHLLVVNHVHQHEPVRHQQVERSDNQVINRLQTGHSVHKAESVLGDSIHDTLNESHDREVLDSPAEATTVPEERTAKILVPGHGEVGEGSSLVALFAHQANAKMGRLNHIDIVCTITNGQGDLTAGELAHEGDNLSLLSWRGAIDNDRASFDQEIAELLMHVLVVESDSNYNTRDDNLVLLSFPGLGHLEVLADFLIQIGRIVISILEDVDSSSVSR